MGGPCGANAVEEQRVWFIGRVARWKETTRTTKTRWVNNIMMGLVRIECGAVGWIGVA
jgi:hypothetical protein